MLDTATDYNKIANPPHADVLFTFATITWMHSRSLHPLALLNIENRMICGAALPGMSWVIYHDFALPCMVFAGIVSTLRRKICRTGKIAAWFLLHRYFADYLTGGNVPFAKDAASLREPVLPERFVFPSSSSAERLAAGTYRALYFIMPHPVMFFSTYHLFFRSRASRQKIKWSRLSTRF